VHLDEIRPGAGDLDEVLTLVLRLGFEVEGGPWYLSSGTSHEPRRVPVPANIIL
jgi:hypothetical protein